jgi:hypothetical protein
MAPSQPRRKRSLTKGSTSKEITAKNWKELRFQSCKLFLEVFCREAGKFLGSKGLAFLLYLLYTLIYVFLLKK